MSDTEDLAALNDRLMAKNHALAEALSRAGKELTKAKSRLAQLAQPPLTFATMVKVDSTRTDGMNWPDMKKCFYGHDAIIPSCSSSNVL